MKVVTAFVHRGRISDIVHALEAAGFRYLTVIDVKGLLNAISAHEEHYSIELGEKVTDEIKLELICNDDKTTEAVELIHRHARTGQPIAGLVYVTPVEAYQVINGTNT
ncbi:P-II family nitrogen regulator [Permianibacter sp. IMCC34836]|uniref:P-II family nitrogen regulator n=1 Tax=Permianibacter fluminis TaxID=2738515 RepID=UPI001551B2A8|nr:P-II family nitrogen regulator [Permianibacter fluminis]NQD37642.1 P-II family nitrogen regulator [Permianibacter fluminis]